MSFAFLHKKSSQAEWQNAYDQEYSRYSKMIHEYDSIKNGLHDYRLEQVCDSWSHKMVEASLGVHWFHTFSHVSEKKRQESWQKLKRACQKMDYEEDALEGNEEMPCSKSGINMVLPQDDEIIRQSEKMEALSNDFSLI